MNGGTAFRAAILAALPDARLPDAIEPGELMRFATSDRRGDDAGWLKLFIDGRAGVFGDWRSKFSQTWIAAGRALMTRIERVELARQVAAAKAERDLQRREGWSVNAQRIAAIWSASYPLVGGDPVALYLKHRGFGMLWPLPDSLRLHPAMPYWDGAKKLGTYPAMVAPLTAPDGRIVALHRTYLTRDGRKADVPKVKKLTPASGPLAGSCIALFKPAKGSVGIAEGIETALAAWCASSVPTVAAYCAGNLAAWSWPSGVRRIVVFADADEAGAKAAGELRQRAMRSGLSVNVMTPSTPGADWCDVWALRRAAEVSA